MRTLGRRAIIATLALALLGAGFCPSRAFADGDEKSEAPKTRSPKIEAPAPLTERERFLLDRLWQLEQRVAELESKSSAKPQVDQIAATSLAAPSPATTGHPPASASASSVP